MQRNEDGARQERSGWRDLELNNRHRLWGRDCPAADIDALFVEYTRHVPVALVEYKVSGAPWPEPATREALTHVADDRWEPLPLLLVYYQKEPWAFRVHPLNVAGHQHFQAGERLTERDYVLRLYQIRGDTLDPEIAARLDNTMGTRLP